MKRRMAWMGLLLLMGCGRKSVYHADYGRELFSEDAYDYVEEEAMAFDGVQYHGALLAPGETASLGATGKADAAPSPEPRDDKSDLEQPERKLHYEGGLELRSPRPVSLLDEVEGLVKDQGGYIESRSDTWLSAQVPVAAFLETFEQVATMAPVEDRWLSAQDITAAWSEAELRTRLAKETRQRLVDLLQRSQDEEEKLKLLREIRRLTEQIDRYEIQLKVLSEMAAMSRLEVSVSGWTEAVTELRPVWGLEFIEHLTAFETTLFGDALELEAPDGLVELESDELFRAESADGVILRATRVPNEPVGDSNFWLESIRFRLSPEFASADAVELGSFQGLSLVEPSDQPYTYMVGVRAEGRWLDVVEITYPSAEHQERYHEAVLESLQEVES